MVIIGTNICVRRQVCHNLSRFTLHIIFFTAADKSSRSRKLKHDVIEAVNELIQDIGTCHDQIAEQAVEHIHQKYVIFSCLNK